MVSSQTIILGTPDNWKVGWSTWTIVSSLEYNCVSNNPSPCPTSSSIPETKHL